MKTRTSILGLLMPLLFALPCLLASPALAGEVYYMTDKKLSSDEVHRSLDILDTSIARSTKSVLLEGEFEQEEELEGEVYADEHFVKEEYGLNPPLPKKPLAKEEGLVFYNAKMRCRFFGALQRCKALKPYKLTPFVYNEDFAKHVVLDRTSDLLNNAFGLDPNGNYKGVMPIEQWDFNYALPVYYHFSQMGDPEMQQIETKIQASVKVKIWPKMFKSNLDLIITYTQQSYFQIYNRKHSAVFRDNNYAPSIFLSIPYHALDYQDGFYGARFGFIHISNGGDRDRSVGVNRIFFSTLFRAGIAMFEFNEFVYVGNNSENIARYMGYGDIRVALAAQKALFMLTLHNPYSVFNKGKFRGNINFEFAYPIYKKLSVYANVFYGYNDALFWYRHKSTNIGIGISLSLIHI